MATQTGVSATHNPPTGQHLRCEACGAEIEVVNACTCDTADQVFQCCSQDMKRVDTMS